MTDNRGDQTREIADPTNRGFEAEFWRRDGEVLRHVVLGLYIYIFGYWHRRLSWCCLCAGAIPPPVRPFNWWKLSTSDWWHSQREDEQPPVSCVGYYLLVLVHDREVIPQGQALLTARLLLSPTSREVIRTCLRCDSITDVLISVECHGHWPTEMLQALDPHQWPEARDAGTIDGASIATASQEALTASVGGKSDDAAELSEFGEDDGQRLSTCSLPRLATASANATRSGCSSPSSILTCSG